MMRLGALRGLDPSTEADLAGLRSSVLRYLRRPEDEREQRRVPVDDAIFQSPGLRLPVAERCLGKCFFCECEVPDDTMVEHFRPRRDALTPDGDVDPYHYAWLAYEPDNMAMVCQVCGSNKGTAFPLRGGRARYLAPLAEARRDEKPLLVDAYRGRPGRHFEFLADGRCEPRTDEGRTTVALVRLNRPALVEARRACLRRLLDELDEAIDVRAAARASAGLFDARRAHAGARLGLLDRLLRATFGDAERPSGGPSGLPAALPRFLAELSDEGGRRLHDRIAALPAADADRPDWDEDGWRPPSPSSLGRRSRVATPTRNGGIRTVEVANFKAVEALSLELNEARPSSRGVPCLMLLGENAVGKSSVLQAIALALVGLVEARRLGLDAADLVHVDGLREGRPADPREASVRIRFSVANEPATLRVGSDDSRILGRHGPSCLVMGYGPRRFFDARQARAAEGNHGRVRTLFDPLATIPHPGPWLNGIDGDAFRQVAKIMRLVLTLGEDDELVRDDDGRICVRITGAVVPIEHMSEGYRSVFAMVADIARELSERHLLLEDAEAVVLVDEVETNLHPRWKMRIMSSLRTAFPRVQFIVTTHDPLCLRGMDDGEVVVLQRDEAGRVAALEGLPSIKGMRADQLLTSDYFGLSSTVDPETELAVARLAARPGEDADREGLVGRLVVGDDAGGQLVHEAVRTFLVERERPAGGLRTEVRAEALRRVLEALRRPDEGTSS